VIKFNKKPHNVNDEIKKKNTVKRLLLF
jgi:hypothetical protein